MDGKRFDYKDGINKIKEKLDKVGNVTNFYKNRNNNYNIPQINKYNKINNNIIKDNNNTKDNKNNWGNRKLQDKKDNKNNWGNSERKGKYK